MMETSLVENWKDYSKPTQSNRIEINVCPGSGKKHFTVPSLKDLSLRSTRETVVRIVVVFDSISGTCQHLLASVLCSPLCLLIFSMLTIMKNGLHFLDIYRMLTAFMAIGPTFGMILCIERTLLLQNLSQCRY
jgi:hypothetical protein